MRSCVCMYIYIYIYMCVCVCSIHTLLNKSNKNVYISVSQFSIRKTNMK